MKVEERTVSQLPTMKIGKRLDGLECQVQGRWVIVGEDGLAENYPIITKEHVRLETIGHKEVHLGDIKTVCGTSIMTNDLWKPRLSKTQGRLSA